MVKARTLEAGDVHVWTWALNQQDDAVLDLQRVLSPDEEARANRFRSRADRASFIAARSGLRHLLAVYVDRPPAALRFTYGPQGKPALSEPTHDVHFNLSHTRDTAALAVTLAGETGIDIEKVRPIDEDLAAVFTPHERAAIAALPSVDRYQGLLRCWTRKEAIIKAVGTGFSYDVLSLEVSLDTDQPRILRLGGNDSPATWSLHHISPSPNLIGAVAVRQPHVRLRHYGRPDEPLALS